MTLEPQVATLLTGLAALPAVDFATVTPAEVRGTYAMLSAAAMDVPQMPVSDHSVNGPSGPIPVHVYVPEGSSADGPVLVWLHGGGWTIGDVATSDPVVRRLAAATGIRVVSVDYRLAPEHPFPAPLEDADAAVRAVAAGDLGGPPSRIAVGGDSAGGNLAAVISRRARDAGGPPIALQLLVYPVTDCGLDTPSYRENADGYLLTATTMRWFFDQYTGGDVAARESVDVSPLRADSVADLPPAYVVTAGYDPLRDEGEAYADRLAAAGVPVTKVRYDGQIHSFFGQPELFGPTAQDALEAAALAVRKALTD